MNHLSLVKIFALLFLVTVCEQAICQENTATLVAEDEKTETVELGGKTLPLVFSEDFEEGHDKWEVTDDEAWIHRKLDHGNHVFGLNKRKSDYQPEHRSPHNIALVKDLELDDFVITFDVMSTKDTGDHRDCCVFFAYQNANQFYYCHLGACLLYTSPSPRDATLSRMPSSA